MASLALLAAITAAASVDNQWKDAGVLDSWGQYGTMQTKRRRAQFSDKQFVEDKGIISRTPLHPDILKALAKRTSISDYKNHLPGCSSADDPSYAPQKPGWEINAGVKVPLEDHETCYDGSTCWNDWLLVEAAVEYVSWQPAGGAITCDGTKTCSSAETNIKQSCSTVGTTESSGFDHKVIEGALSFDFGSAAYRGGLEASMAYTITKSTTDYNLNQVCSSSQSTQTCQWEPDTSEGADNCHQVWYADRILHVWGQAQRMCKKSTKGAVQQNTRIEDKLWVRGQKEFDFVLPINKLVHCNGKCSDSHAGLSIPPNGPRQAYQEPVN